MPLSFTPPTGLLDTSAFPTVPVNETAARQQFMNLFNQLRDYLNGSMSPTGDLIVTGEIYAQLLATPSKRVRARYDSTLDEAQVIGENAGTSFMPLTIVSNGFKYRPSVFAQNTTAYDVVTSLLVKTGAGVPEGVVTANVGTLFLRTDGGAGTTLYVKQSGTGNTGWIAK